MSPSERAIQTDCKSGINWIPTIEPRTSAFSDSVFALDVIGNLVYSIADSISPVYIYIFLFYFIIIIIFCHMIKINDSFDIAIRYNYK